MTSTVLITTLLSNLILLLLLLYSLTYKAIYYPDLKVTLTLKGKKPPSLSLF